MFKNTHVFSSYSVDDISKAKQFYGEALGLEVTEELAPMTMLTIKLATGGTVLLYPKGEAHAPATFTVLNFPVKDIDEAVEMLTAKGVKFEHYDTDDITTDDKGIARSNSTEEGPNVAWFKDPAGNILSVLEIE